MIGNVPHVSGVCKCKDYKTGGGEVAIDRLSEVPEEILLSIMSGLTLKEAGRTSLVSKRWKQLWRHYPVLNFEDSAAMEGMGYHTVAITKVKSRFVAHVTHVLKQHLGLAIDELGISFDLDNSYKSDIDHWVSFALEKHVNKIELNLQPSWALRPLHDWLINIRYPQRVHYTWPCIQSHNLPSSLRTLCLRNVDISSNDVQTILQSCRLLEALCVVRSDILTSLRAPGCSLMLQYLEIGNCPNLETVDICAPKLLSFKYDSKKPIKLHITQAALLSEVHIGGEIRDLIAPAFESISMYFSNLKYLSLKMSLVGKINLKPNHVPVLSRLVHLRLYFCSCSYETLLGWTSLLEACPVLEKLTIELIPLRYRWDSERPFVKVPGRPLVCLKTMEIIGFTGRKHDIEFAYYVLENATKLEEVIIDMRTPISRDHIKYAQQRMRLLRKKIPEGVKLVIIET